MGRGGDGEGREGDGDGKVMGGEGREGDGEGEVVQYLGLHTAASLCPHLAHIFLHVERSFG